MNSDSAQSAAPMRGLLLEALLVLFGAAALYLGTICPSIGFGDTALLIDAIMRAHLHSHVNNHPLSVALGYLFTRLPVGEIAFRANLTSVVLGAVTVALLFLCWRVQGVSRVLAVAMAAATAVSHSLWWHSTLVENYAVSAALVAACYLLLTLFQRSLQRRFLYAACVVAGLSLLNHVQNGFLCLAVAVVGFVSLWRAVDRLKALFLCTVSAGVGLLPWIALIVRDASSDGLREALNGAFFGKFEDTFFSESLGRAVYEIAYLLWWQSPLGLMALGAALGITWYVRRFGVSAVFLGMATHIVLTVCVFAGYATWDRFAFLLAGFVGLHYFAGLGLEEVHRQLGRRWGMALALVWTSLTVVIGPTLYASVVGWAQDPLSVWRERYSRGYSAHLYDQAEYIANPNKRRYREVEAFAALLFEKLPPDSLFLDDDSRSYYPLAEYYQRYYKVRPDISFQLVNSWGFSDWGLTSDSLLKLVEQAYYLDKPFFVASTGSPYNTFFNAISARIPVAFERFPLSSDRWVYRLVTARTGGRQTAIAKLIEKGYLRPMVVRGARGEVDLALENLSFSASSGVQIQKMETFGPTWLMNNQLFVSATNPGSEVEFVLLSEGDRKVRAALFLSKAPDFGNVRISVGDTVLGEFSLYSPLVERVKVDIGEISLTAAGAIVSLKVVGKSDASTGYKMGIDSVQFE